MNSESVTGVREGEILAGKYRIDEILGAGGMGVVVLAHHLHLDERVAIKFLLPGAVGDAEAMARFAREARAAVKIKSEHVARVSDVGKLESGAPYMVMEYLDGTDLAEYLERQGRLPYEQAIDFILQASEAIAEAHVLGIVHRDLKPANLFLIRRPDGTPSIKVLDFGISKVNALAGSGPAASITKTSAMMGSPLYMSPEQLQSSKNVDARSDIWALGVILYELIAGQSPFTGTSIPELCTKILGAPPPPLRQLQPDVPERLELVLNRCLEKARERRFSSVAELAAALYPLAGARSRISVERISGVQRAPEFRPMETRASVAAAPAEDAPEAAGTQGAFGRTNTPLPRPQRRFGSLIAGLFVLALGAGTALLLWPRWNAGGPSSSPSGVTGALPATGLPPATAAAPPVEDVTAPVETVATAAPSGAAPAPSADSIPAARSAPARPARTRSAPNEPPQPAPSPTPPPQPAPSPAPPAAESPKPEVVKPPPPPPPAEESRSIYDDRK